MTTPTNAKTLSSNFLFTMQNDDAVSSFERDETKVQKVGLVKLCCHLQRKGCDDMGIFPIAGPAYVEVQCEYCDQKATPCICEIDRRYHNHGGVHSPNHSLVFVCKRHASEINAEWKTLEG